ncbi:MAG TPA: Crp/Fnr family transcriptional regulator [Gemmatimonadaceae bacterium]|nr:Crp/Fnr family transcriptional regulator [Gemmatimonadaceae bacterium]
MLDPALLAPLPFLRDAAPAVIETLARHAVERRYAAAEVIFTAGAEPRGLFIVLEGQVRVLRARGGRQHVVHTERAGGTLGEVPLFADGAYPATAVAAEPTRCALLSREAIRAAIATNPEIAFLLLGRLASRVRVLVERLDRVALQGARARLAAYILSRPPGRDGRTLTLGMTQSELAEELGTVREIVVRGLQELRRRGAIRSIGGGRLEILSRAALERMAEE